jgi:hypothetical protein
MEQWSSFFFDVAAWTLALLAAFEGARRIAGSRRTRTALVLIAVGVVWCAVKGGLALYVARSMETMVEAERNRTINELSHDWGSELSPAEREKSSLAYARVAFNSTGRLIDYFNQSGERKRFTPNQDQLRERDATVELWQRAENTSVRAQSQGLRWILSLLVALIAGIAVGAKNDGVRRSGGGVGSE